MEQSQKNIAGKIWVGRREARAGARSEQLFLPFPRPWSGPKAWWESDSLTGSMSAEALAGEKYQSLHRKPVRTGVEQRGRQETQATPATSQPRFHFLSVKRAELFQLTTKQKKRDNQARKD